MHNLPSTLRRQARPALRDRFLMALDRSDTIAVREIARDLIGCTDSLPTLTCIDLGLMPGSTYGDAAETVTRQAHAGSSSGVADQAANEEAVRS